MLITPEQIRAARALLRLDQEDLARRANVSVVTIRRLEGADGTERVAESTIEGVRQVLEAAGAEFIPDGVRRRRERQRDSDAMYRDLKAIAERSAAQLAGMPAFSEADLYDEDGLPA